MTDKSERLLDVTGKCCPMPIVELNRAMKELASGQVLEVVATDPGTRTDIPSWCERNGAELVEMAEEEGRYRYRLCKQ